MLERDVWLVYSLLLRGVQGLIDREFRRKSWRTMVALKEHCESSD